MGDNEKNNGDKWFDGYALLILYLFFLLACAAFALNR